MFVRRDAAVRYFDDHLGFGPDSPTPNGDVVDEDDVVGWDDSRPCPGRLSTLVGDERIDRHLGILGTVIAEVQRESRRGSRRNGRGCRVEDREDRL